MSAVATPERGSLPELDLDGDVVTLLERLVDIESVSGHETPIADAVERALRRYDHLRVTRDGNVVLARTDATQTDAIRTDATGADGGRPDRVVVAGHLDTVPVAGNLPSRRTGTGDEALIWGRGACDMKGGVAAQLSAAAALTAPSRDVTWVFYDNEEVEERFNGLARVAREHPEWLAADFAVLCEPTSARIEGGCQGTMRVLVELSGVAAHSARSWRGRNAIHEAADVLRRLADYAPRQVEVDGLVYREGLNAVRISGGIAGNVIPDRCTVEVNYRFAPSTDPAGAEAHLREVFDGFDVRVTDVAPGARPGLDSPAAAQFLAAVGGEASAKYGWTDVARFSAMGIPAVNFGPGDPGKAHADDEFCPAADVRRCRQALLDWLGA